MDRCADPSVQLQVDEAILDYLLYTTTRSLLEQSKSVLSSNDGSKTPSRAELPLQMVDCKIYQGVDLCNVSRLQYV